MLQQGPALLTENIRQGMHIQVMPSLIQCHQRKSCDRIPDVFISSVVEVFRANANSAQSCKDCDVVLVGSVAHRSTCTHPHGQVPASEVKQCWRFGASLLFIWGGTNIFEDVTKLTNSTSQFLHDGAEFGKGKDRLKGNLEAGDALTDMMWRQGMP